MRRARSAAAGLLAGVLALSLVAAETPAAAEGAGTASTRLLGADVTVTNIGDDVSARLMDITSTATTEGTPFASTGIVPIQVGDTTYGETGASSDGSTEASSDGAGFGNLAGSLGLVVNPVSTSATASADRALATVEAATGELGALLGAVGLDLDTTGVTSLATREDAAATQGMTVSGLSLGLGDLGLDADVLGQLGLDNILELLGALPGILPADMEGVPDVLATIEELEAALATLGTEAGPLVTQIETVTAEAQALLDEIAELEALVAELEALLADPTSLTLLEDLLALADDLEAAGCPLPEDLTGLDLLTVIQDTIDCLNAQIATLEGELEALLGELAIDVAPVLALVDEITALVEEILAMLGDLDGLLDMLPDLLADAAAMDLLSVGAFDVGTTAIAGETLEDSSATVLCDAVDVSVLGESFATPDCSAALAQLSGVTATISGAVDQIADVLNTLPLGELVQVGELRADLFTDLVESVSEADGVVTSVAGFTLLDLAVPSITLDPTQVTSALDDLGLPVDLVATVEGVLGDLDGALGGLDAVLTAAEDLGLVVDTIDDQVDAVDAAIAGLGVETGLGDLVDQVQALLDGLDLGAIGSLSEPISTPGLELLIDPTSTATFAAGAGGGIAAPAPTPEEPAPAPSEPTLPSTGGGLALLGVLALAGAGALRRRDR